MPTSRCWLARTSELADQNSGLLATQPKSRYLYVPSTAFGVATTYPSGATRWRFESTR
jgi:hypothetical protein